MDVGCQSGKEFTFVQKEKKGHQQQNGRGGKEGKREKEQSLLVSFKTFYVLLGAIKPQQLIKCESKSHKQDQGNLGKTKK